MAKLLTLQVVRGVAANLVVLEHLTQFEARYADTKFPGFAHYGNLGVDIFFVLSGFIMVAIAGRHVTALQFLWRRAVRIYPTYWLATLIMIAAWVSVPGLVHEDIASIPLWRSFLLVAASPNSPVVSVGWTLVHEVYFYLVFAGFLAFRISIPIGTAAWGAIIVIARAVLPNNVIANFPELDVMTHPLTFEFMMGIVIGMLWLHQPKPRILVNGGVVALLGLLTVLALLIGLHYHFFAHEVGQYGIIPFGDTTYLDSVRVVTFGPPIALILYCLVSYESRLTRGVPKLLVAIGDWSYSTYLFHFMALSAFARLVLRLFPEHGNYAAVTLLVFGFIVSNLAGAAVYVLFERPTLKWLHRFKPAVSKVIEPRNPVKI